MRLVSNLEDAVNDVSSPRAYLGIDDRRRQLLDAAWEVMRDGGAATLSLRTVAQRAGVAHRVVTYAFGTKSALVAALLERESARAVEAAWAVPLAAESRERAVARALRAYLDDVRADPRRHESLAELTALARSAGEPADAAEIESAAALSEIDARLRAWESARGVHSLAPREVVAGAILAAAGGLAQWWLATRDDTRADAIIDLLARGFTDPDAAASGS